MTPELESAISLLLSQALDAAGVVEQSGLGWANQIRTTCDKLAYQVERAKGRDVTFSRQWSVPEPWDVPGELPSS